MYFDELDNLEGLDTFRAKLNTMLAAALAGPIRVVNGKVGVAVFGQSNAAGYEQPTTPAANNLNVHVWQANDVQTPTSWSRVQANPALVTNYTGAEILVGIRGNGYANTALAFCDELQKRLGVEVELFSVCLSGSPIANFANGESVSDVIFAQMSNAMTALGIDFPSVYLWLQGASDTGEFRGAPNNFPELEAWDYAAQFLDFKSRIEAEVGGVNESFWLLFEPSAGYMPWWNGLAEIDRITNDTVRTVGTRGFAKTDAYHFTGDAANELGVLACRMLTGGMSFKSINHPHVHVSNVDPTTSDNWTNGFNVGQLWLNKTNYKLFVMVREHVALGTHIGTWEEVSYAA